MPAAAGNLAWTTVTRRTEWNHTVRCLLWLHHLLQLVAVVMTSLPVYSVPPASETKCKLKIQVSEFPIQLCSKLLLETNSSVANYFWMTWTQCRKWHKSHKLSKQADACHQHRLIWPLTCLKHSHVHTVMYTHNDTVSLQIYLKVEFNNASSKTLHRHMTPLD